MTGLSGPWSAVDGGVALLTLVPIVWAIVDVLRRPATQFSTARKVLWAVTLGVGWLLLWPLALLSSLLYLFVIRRRLPGPATATGAAPAAGAPSTGPVPAPEPPPVVPPAGWYADPAGPGERWWDGRGWSEHLRPRP